MAPAQGFTDQVAMRDGIRLATDVRLLGDGRRPAMLFRTPYLRTNEFLPVQPSGDLPVAVVLQDVRGRFGSEGSFDLGAHDAADGADTIAWIRAQPWSDGRVSMHGISYAGHTQLQAARAKPEGLVSIAPIRCPAWWRPLTMHEGGALLLSLAAHWLPLQAMEAPGSTDSDRAALARIVLTFDQICDYPPGPPTSRCTLDLARALQHEGLMRRPLRRRPEFDELPDFRVAWRRLFEEPFTGSWIDDPGPVETDSPSCQTLLLSGWYDCWAQDAVAMFQALQRSGTESRLVMTPYSHAPEPVGDLPWGDDAGQFDDWCGVDWNREWLLDSSNRLRDLAPVTYFLVNAGTWHESATWPPSNSTTLTLHCAAGEGRGSGALQRKAPDDEGTVRFAYDPRDPMPSRGGFALGLPAGPMEQTGLDAASRLDVCSFTGELLQRDLVLAGPVTATVHLSSDAPDTDVVVKLLDVMPDGRAYNIADGVVRARFRPGGAGAALRPGVAEVFRIHCWNIAYRVPAGDRLRLDVTSSNFPRHDPNPNTGAPLGSDLDDDLRAARQTVHTGPVRPTTVQLTVVS